MTEPAQATDPAQAADIAPAKDAASLLLLRKAGTDMQVLMGMRGAGHRFMPNHLVFPGGGVDPGDHTAPLASPARADLVERLTLDGRASLAHALLHAAARELEEETGLHLGHPPDVSEIDYLCRAITPVGRPVRFDARFLLIDAAHAQGTLGGSGELEGLRWYGVGEALALELAYPTRKVLEQLTAWLDRPAQTRRVAQPTPVMRDRVWQME